MTRVFVADHHASRISTVEKHRFVGTRHLEWCRKFSAVFLCHPRDIVCRFTPHLTNSRNERRKECSNRDCACKSTDYLCRAVVSHISKEPCESSEKRDQNDHG